MDSPLSLHDLIRKKPVAILLLTSMLIAVSGVLVVGTLLTAPVPQRISTSQVKQPLQSVEFESESGTTIHGWLMPGVKDKGVIVLMHGVRSNRLSMLSRAEFLNRHGFAVLLFDFQAHGESAGKHITFGYLESRDATAAVNFIRSKYPEERIGVLGVSMGGAAALLASPPLKADALILEMVYPTIDHAVDNRLAMRFGGWATILSPLLLWQLRWRFGVDPVDLRPIDHVSQIKIPKLIIAGAKDQHTTIHESRELYEAASDPKEFWLVDDAAHIDFHEFAKDEYESRVLSFFNDHLR